MAIRSDRADIRALKVLDVIKDSVAVLDSQGFIIQTNRAWDEFAKSNSSAKGSIPKNVGVGTNYLSVCRDSRGPSAENALVVLNGISDVLAGRKRTFSLEYPCHSKKSKRWFVLTVSALRGARPKEVVVVHHDITTQRLAEIDYLSKQREVAASLENLQVLARQIKESIYLDSDLPGLPLITGAARLDGSHVNPRRGPDPAYKKLSKREKEVLYAIVRGERNAEISERLQLSAKSISTYRSRILVKLKVRNDAELVALVTRLGAP